MTPAREAAHTLNSEQVWITDPTVGQRRFAGRLYRSGRAWVATDATHLTDGRAPQHRQFATKRDAMRFLSGGGFWHATSN